MKVLITGCLGLLGQRLVEHRPEDVEVIVTDLSLDPQFMPTALYRPCDLTQRAQVDDLFEQEQPDHVINTAAFTNVDGAEDEPELCRLINVAAVENLAHACRRQQASICQISTDYIFDGQNGPYSENAIPHPLGAYGQSKWAAEQVLLEAAVPFAIARTMVLYGHSRNKRPEFVGWLINKLKNRESVRIVTDQIGNATLNDEFAIALWQLTRHSFRGIVNVAGREIMSRYDFSLRIAGVFGLDASLITPITTADLHQKAPRPLRSGLIVDKAVNELDLLLSDMDGGLKKYKLLMENERRDL
jgi:dTDP-4-dehydrorhamnose reductase